MITWLLTAWLCVAPLADIDALESRAQKEVEEATELLGKVQTGQITYKAAMEKMKGFMAHLEEFEQASEKRAAKYLEELQQTMYWTKKFAPLTPEILAGGTAPAAPPTTPSPGNGPPAPPPTTPDPKDAPAPPPAVPPAPPDFTPPTLPTDPKAVPAALLPYLSDPDPRARTWAARLVVLTPDAALIDRCFALLKADPDENVLGAARFALLVTRHDAVFAGIAKAVEDWDGEPLERLVDLAKEKPEPRTVVALFDLAMRFTPPIGGANSQSKPAMAAYEARAKAAWGDGWRARVIQIWKSWPEPLISAGLTEAWKARKGAKFLREKQEILLAVGVIGNARGIRHCVPFLTKGEEIACPLRAPAFAAVELVGKPGVPWLIQGLGTESTNLWCWQALYNITGENRGRKGESIRRWSEWWNENR